MVELYKKGDKRNAVSLLIKELEKRVHEVCMTAPSYNELQAIYMSRNLYLPNNMEVYTPEEENDIY